MNLGGKKDYSLVLYVWTEKRCCLGVDLNSRVGHPCQDTRENYGL